MELEEMRKTHKAIRREICQAYDEKYQEYPSEIAVDEVMQAILNYCNLTEFPWELRFVAMNMLHALLNPDEANGAKSISVGDTRVELSRDEATAKAQSLLYNFQSQLQEFRRLRW